LTNDFAFFQSVGKRETQEDAAGVIAGTSLFFSCEAPEQSGRYASSISAVVCDGMGGHTSGEIAASLACRKFLETFNPDSEQSPNPDAMLAAACTSANEAISQAVDSNSSLDGMGTTFAAVSVRGGLLHWVSVGDSHILLLRRRRLIKLNEDHSMRPVIDAMLRRGLIAPEDAARRSDRNALRSALTGDSIDLIDRGAGGLPFAPGDIVLLASDGLDVVGKSFIERALRGWWRGDLATRVRSIVFEADRVGGRGQDNTTLVAISSGGRAFSLAASAKARH
jgi:serine/threonine protein phosphatase PrpC